MSILHHSSLHKCLIFPQDKFLKAELLIQRSTMFYSLLAHTVPGNLNHYASSSILHFLTLLPKLSIIILFICCLSDRQTDGGVLLSIAFIWLLMSLNIPSYVEKHFLKKWFLFFWEQHQKKSNQLQKEKLKWNRCLE